MDPSSVNRKDGCLLPIATRNLLMHPPLGTVLRETGKENAHGSLLAEDKLSSIADLFPEHHRPELRGFELSLRETVRLQQAKPGMRRQFTENRIADVPIGI